MGTSNKIYVTPWINMEEFNEVYHALYSDNIDLMLWGLQRVEMWKHRSYPALSSAIDVTACLIRAKVQDILLENNLVIVKNDNLGISLLYSMALTRFVNVLSEMAKPKFNLFIPMNKAAERFGIPSWIVDLRNTATHSNLPSLYMLKKGADEALHWLLENYWKKESERTLPVCLNFSVKEKPLSKKCQEILGLFKTTQTSLLHGNSNRKSLVRNLKIIVNMVENRLKKKNSTFLETLLTTDNFFMSHFEMAEIFPSEDIDFLVQNSALDLPESLVKFWAPIIQAINDGQFMHEFIQKIIISATTLDTLTQKTAYSWIKKFLKITVSNGESESKSDHIRIIFEKNQWMLNMGDLLQDCTFNPSIFGISVLDIILDNCYPPIPDKSKHELAVLYTVYLGFFNAKTKNSTQPSRHTLKHFENDLELAESSRHGSKISGLIWKRATNIADWNNLPLGFVFHPTEETTAPSSQINIKVELNDEKPQEIPEIIDPPKPLSIKMQTFTQVSYSNDWNQPQIMTEEMPNEVSLSMNDLY